MKKVLLVNGSPHPQGCTYVALCEVADALQANGVETEICHIGTKPVYGCTGCGACRKTGRCVFEDDFCNTLLSKIQQADGVVLGSPVYYAGVNGALCALLDRVFYAGGKSFDGKLGAAVVSCRRGGAGSAFDRLNKYFTISNMPIVSGQYWNAIHGTKPAEARQDLEGLQMMRTLGTNMAWLLRQLNEAPPAREEPVRFNFIRS